MVSLLTAVDVRDHVHLVVGASPLAAARCSQSLAAGAKPVLVARPPAATAATGGLLPAALQLHVDAGDVRWVRAAFDEKHLTTLGREAVDRVVDAVFVVRSRSDARRRSDNDNDNDENDESDDDLAARISALCRRLRIPVNVADAPALCSFALLSTHADGPLQIGVTTNGSGCQLAARIRREVASALPAGLGQACARLGRLRRRIQAEDRTHAECTEHTQRAQREPKEKDDEHDQPAAFNQLIVGRAEAETARTRRMRWLAQMCEYWPLARLATVTDDDVEALLRAYQQGLVENNTAATTRLVRPAGRIILAGAGPGHPDLLTRAVLHALHTADLVLADKLVPAAVLDLVPRRTEVVIARKYPGNAEAAQDELIAAAVAGARAGKTVLRLKQGDPFVYGRGGEEVLRLRAAGFSDRSVPGGPAPTMVVLPGLTSALTAPLFAGIPPTHRDVADQVLICTGTGKAGKAPVPPGYRQSRTAVFLMALHRIGGLVAELTARTAAEVETQNNSRVLWPLSTPCAVVERASCADQKVIRTTLAHVAAAIEQEGSRPPGLLVVGRACAVLVDSADKEQRLWTVEEGFPGFHLGADDLGVHDLAGVL